MQRLVFAALLGAIAAPAAAQSTPQAYPPSPPPPADGRTMDQLGNVVGALTKAVLDLPVGELEAAIENRPATRADRSKTVRSVTGTNDRDVDQGIERSKETVEAGGEAIARTLPVIRDALNRAGEQIERATANVPQPGYPRR